MGSITVSRLAWNLPGGSELFRDVGFRVGDGDRVAIVGANGVGKSTLLKLITGDLSATEGTISVDGQIGVMHQLVGTSDHPAATVRELLLSLAPERLRHAAGCDSSPSSAAKPTIFCRTYKLRQEIAAVDRTAAIGVLNSTSALWSIPLRPR